MAQVRLALAQLDMTVGDIAANTASVVASAKQAAGRGAHVVAFPEMALTGYPIEDLALRRSFVDAAAAAPAEVARQLQAEGLGELVVVVGYLDHRFDPESNDAITPATPYGDGSGSTGDGADHQGGQVDVAAATSAGALPANAAAVLHRGEVVTRYAKHFLPNYGVFDEFRYFDPGNSLAVIRVHGVDIALGICEDLWQSGGPVAAARACDAGLLLVINASPYERGKARMRSRLLNRRAEEAGCPLAYVNLVGAQDELVFDGDSQIVTADGSVLARAPQFTPGGLVSDLDLPTATAEPPERAAGMRIVHTVISTEPVPAYTAQPPVVTAHLPETAEIYTAIVTGLRDYVLKNGFSSVLVALSGGIDSALTAIVACDALGPDKVYGVSLPSKYSSVGSKDDAADLASRCGLNYRVVAIQPMVDPFLTALDLTGVAEENLQARVRGMILMGMSNADGHLVLATGNKSELSVGYSTLYGDAVGGYAPLKDLPKTMVWALSKWRNADADARGEQRPIPSSSITKPPSAELSPGQLDSDSLPDYDVLDDILDDYVERDAGSADLVAAGFDADLVSRVIQLVDTAEYKRRQYPPGPKISSKAFGRDRRLPITNAWREDADKAHRSAERHAADATDDTAPAPTTADDPTTTPDGRTDRPLRPVPDTPDQHG